MKQPVQYVRVPKSSRNTQADFAVSLINDDMAPMAYQGDLLLCKYQDHVEHGELGVFEIGGKRYAKYLYCRGENCQLVSVNISIAPIFCRLDELHCIGKVIAVTQAIAYETKAGA